MKFDPSLPTTAVFSHPNHELAVFGLMQSLRPSMVFLTDGGGEARVEQTRQGLRRIGLLDRATFLNYTEQSFYDALLDGDAAFYVGVAQRLAEALRPLRPAQVICDAVEYYNPVHDMSLPVVRRALAGDPDTRVFEVPLIYQVPGQDEAYEIQRPLEGRPGESVFPVSPEHLQAKVEARDHVYTILADQMGPVTANVPLEHLALETLVLASQGIQVPEPGRVLRYEWRARLLQERGDIQRTITHAGHYVPVVSKLCSAPPAAQGPQ